MVSSRLAAFAHNKEAPDDAAALAVESWKERQKTRPIQRGHGHACTRVYVVRSEMQLKRLHAETRVCVCETACESVSGAFDFVML